MQKLNAPARSSSQVPVDAYRNLHCAGHEIERRPARPVSLRRDEGQRALQQVPLEGALDVKIGPGHICRDSGRAENEPRNLAEGWPTEKIIASQE